ncbi:unnamed protein product, partial [Ectocarpus fasciculatus]
MMPRNPWPPWTPSGRFTPRSASACCRHGRTSGLSGSGSSTSIGYLSLPSRYLWRGTSETFCWKCRRLLPAESRCCTTWATRQSRSRAPR